MLGFISNLSTFAENSIMAQLPTYQHHNLSNSFAQLNKLLRELLEAVMPVRLQPLQLRREHDSLYVIDTIEASALQNTQLFLAVFLQAENTEWIAQFAKQIKVGTVATIDSIVTSALPGVKLTHMQRPPVRLPIKTGYEYFYIEPTGQFWEQIKIERTLAVFLPDHFTQATIELARIEE
jgi:type VI secretion system protein ImpJ